METGRAAVDAARRNAARLGVTAEYACCPVAEGLGAALDETGPDGTLVVLDPPRDGLEPETLATLLAKRPERIAFVSCSPDRLARDLERLCAPDGGGYSPESVRLFDMFPRTHHFETLALLS
jgi:23S rRNA (uracil1939-C5)-methyltransferase